MIPFDFEYYRPDTLEEALQLFRELEQRHKHPMYYGGGTEIISMARMSNISTGAVIDIKAIPDCRVLEFNDNRLLIGSALTLTQIHESNLFPLLAQAGARVADHTIQNKITLGGNLCGTIIYREALLPLLLSNAELVIASPDGNKLLPVNQIFNERMQLGRGEFIVQAHVEKPCLDFPYIHVKRTKQDKINYPLVTICAMRANEGIRAAFSGICDFPFRSAEMEQQLNSVQLPLEQRIEKALTLLPAPIMNNLDGSAEYRRFLLQGLLNSIINELGG